MITGGHHTAFPMGDASRVGEARRHAAVLAQSMGFDDVAAGRLAIVVTELGSNLVKHAKDGQLLVAARGTAGGPNAAVEVLAMDRGPGIDNVARCMGDGFSTGGTPGTGLGAVRRLADEFDMHSSVPAGTVAVARVRAQHAPAAASGASGFRIGVVATPAPGESVSGDGWAFTASEGRVALLMADGLGHGPAAAEAAQTAVRVFARSPFRALSGVMEDAHSALRATRGAAMTLLQCEGAAIRSAGAGNVVTRVVSGLADRSILTQHGTVGVQIRRPEEVVAEWPRHAAIVVHTDGVMARWPSQAVVPLLTRDPSLLAAVLARDFTRGRDDATVMVVRRKE